MDQKDLDTIVNEALVTEAEEARKAGTVGYMARVLVQATLPHKKTNEMQFIRRNGAFELSITSLNSVGLPYGTIPRLLMSWMTTEAFYTRSPVLELGPTLSSFMAELGLSRTGGVKGDITRFRNQTKRLFSSAVSCRYEDPQRDTGTNFNIADSYDLWWNPKAPSQQPLWKSTVTLGNNFFKEIIDRPVPADMQALKQLKRSPMELDIYFWLTYRMSYLRKDTLIPWALLQMQFGANYAQDAHGLRDFKRNFLTRLKKVQTVYTKAKVFEMEKGLFLKPSPPHVAKHPTPLLPATARKAASSEAAEFIGRALEGGDITIRLKTETYEKAKRAAPRMDVYALEQDWREWIAKTGKRPDDPDAAFIGFCRKKVQPR